MSTLYIDGRGVRLASDGRRLEVRRNGEVDSLPLHIVERVVLMQGVETDTATLTRLADRGIGISIIHGRHPLRMAWVMAPPGIDARRRLAQYATWHDPARCLSLATWFVHLKLRAQHRWIGRLLDSRPDCRRVLCSTAGTLERLLEDLESGRVSSLETLRGLEGAGSAAGFRALAAVVPPALGFTTRRRRPPPDPVNALLSLGYTLLYGLALEAVHAAGLDPAVGFLHEPAAGRCSLAADVMEPLRPRVEELVWELLRQRRLVARHFSRRDGACLLAKAGRERFYQGWEERVPGMRRRLRTMARGVVRRLVEGEGDSL